MAPTYLCSVSRHWGQQPMPANAEISDTWDKVEVRRQLLEFQAEAVRRGAATWEVSDDGSTTFKWILEPESEGE